jgi:hypothetical protein
VDSGASAINKVKRIAAEKNLRNVTAKVGPKAEIILCSKCVDIVLFIIIFHDIGDQKSVAKRQVDAQTDWNVDKHGLE